MTDITELARRMKAAAVRAKTATEEYASGHMSVSVCYAECEEFNRLTDGPDNIIALAEALEKAQRANAAQDDHINQQQDRIDILEKRNAELGREVTHLQSLKTVNAARQEAQSEFHRGYSCGHKDALLESRTVTAENLQESAYRAGLTSGWNLGLANNNDGFNKCLAAHAAGIKVEDE